MDIWRLGHPPNRALNLFNSTPIDFFSDAGISKQGRIVAIGTGGMYLQSDFQWIWATLAGINAGRLSLPSGLDLSVRSSIRIFSGNFVDKIYAFNPLPSFFEDFITSLLDQPNKWTVTVTGGTVLIINADNGVVELATGAVAANNARLHLAATPYDRNNLTIMEIRLKLGQAIDANTTLQFGLVSIDFNPSGDPAGTTVCGIISALAGGTYNGGTADGAVFSKTALGINPSNAYHTFRIEMTAADVRFFQDDVLLLTKTTNLPPLATNMKPWVAIHTLAAASKLLDVDYISVTQQRTFP